jgi:hypothetical protein
VPHLRYTHDRKRTWSLPFLARQRFTALRLASTRSRRGEKGHSNTTHPGTKEGPHTAVTYAHWIRTQLSEHTIPYELHTDYPPPAPALTRRKPIPTLTEHQTYSPSIRKGVVSLSIYAHDRKQTRLLSFLARQEFTALGLVSTRPRRVRREDAIKYIKFKNKLKQQLLSITVTFIHNHFYSQLLSFTDNLFIRQHH